MVNNVDDKRQYFVENLHFARNFNKPQLKQYFVEGIFVDGPGCWNGPLTVAGNYC